MNCPRSRTWGRGVAWSKELAGAGVNVLSSAESSLGEGRSCDRCKSCVLPSVFSRNDIIPHIQTFPESGFVKVNVFIRGNGVLVKVGSILKPGRFRAMTWNFPIKYLEYAGIRCHHFSMLNF